MKERPIIFTGDSVRAILAGRKTQTRRICKYRHLTFLGGQGERDDPDAWGWSFDGPDHNGYMVLGRGHNERHDHGSISIPCPYGEPGDALWVKETFCYADPEFRIDGGAPIYYAATDDGVEASGFRKDGQPRSPWSSSMFMPRAASRITLRVTSVRVERVQAVSEADAWAEGVEPASTGRRVYPGTGAAFVETRRAGFEQAWNAINGKRAPWSVNPWVWVVGFEVAR